MTTRLKSIDGTLFLNYTKGPVHFMVSVTEADMRRLGKDIETIVPPEEPKPPRPPSKRRSSIRGIVVGTELEVATLSDANWPDFKFKTGDRVCVVYDPARNDDDEWVLPCVLASDYDRFLANPDNVDGEELLLSEVKRIPTTKDKS